MSIVTSLFNNFWSEIWFISIWSASVSCNLSLSYPLHFIKTCSTVSGRSHLTQSPDSCFPILYNEWLSAVCDIMLSFFLFPKILLSFPTVFWILYKCRPFSSPSHLLCHISFNAFLINPFISNLLIGTLNSISGCFNVFFAIWSTTSFPSIPICAGKRESLLQSIQYVRDWSCVCVCDYVVLVHTGILHLNFPVVCLPTALKHQKKKKKKFPCVSPDV